ncbi:MAG: hypothetical protein E7358_05665 [Clostridiales bacterium]|nr:hypothetical protein [Clostridiales bacterium]
MEKVFNVKNQIECISDVLPHIDEMFFGNVNDGLDVVCKNFTRGKIELVMTESDYSRLGHSIVQKLKTLPVEVGLLLIEDSDCYFNSIKSMLDKNSGACIALGDKDLLSAVRYYSSLYGICSYAIVTTPNFDKILCDSVWLKTKVLSSEIKAERFRKIIIDQNLIEKSSRESFAEAFSSSASKLTSLIDYKMNCFVSGETVDDWVFAVAKKAISFSLSTPKYENFTAPIIASQVLLAVINGKGSYLLDSGVECLKSSLSVFAPNLSLAKREMLAFEKTARIYHLFFSNDFSNLLSTEDYYSDIELLERESKRDRINFTKNLKIPSERRRTLINLLISKTASDFKAETTVILKAFSKINKIYNAILGENRQREMASFKQIKNAVTTCSYFTAKTTIFTLARDMGILKCIN